MGTASGHIISVGTERRSETVACINWDRILWPESQQEANVDPGTCSTAGFRCWSIWRLMCPVHRGYRSSRSLQSPCFTLGGEGRRSKRRPSVDCQAIEHKLPAFLLCPDWNANTATQSLDYKNQPFSKGAQCFTVCRLLFLCVWWHFHKFPELSGKTSCVCAKLLPSSAAQSLVLPKRRLGSCSPSFLRSCKREKLWARMMMHGIWHAANVKLAWGACFSMPSDGWR